MEAKRNGGYGMNGKTERMEGEAKKNGGEEAWRVWNEWKNGKNGRRGKKEWRRRGMEGTERMEGRKEGRNDGRTDGRKEGRKGWKVWKVWKEWNGMEWNGRTDGRM